MHTHPYIHVVLSYKQMHIFNGNILYILSYKCTSTDGQLD